MPNSGEKYVHLGIAFGLLITAIWGFWPTYFGPLLRGDVGRPWIIHLHAAVFVGWLILLVTQASLIAAGRTRMHRQLGQAGIAYGALVLLLGFSIGIALPVMRVHANQLAPDRAALAVVYNLTDILISAGFLVSAILLRRRADFHARLILSAAVALTGAAVGRVIPSGTLEYLLIWLAPVLVLIIADVSMKSRPHPVSLVALAILVVAFFKVDLLAHSQIALSIGQGLLTVFA
jgi:hypothetical protein